jgi:hypothetical protein
MSERTEGDDTCPDCGGVTPCPLDCTGSTGPADAIVEWLGPEDADEAQCSTDDLIAALDVVRDSCDTHDDDGRSDEQVIRAAMKRLARLAGPADAGSHDPNDIETVVDFVLGWFPGYEDAIHWGSEGPRGERKETNAVYQAALRLAASASAPAVPRETTKEEKADMSPGNPASDGDEHPPSTPPICTICKKPMVHGYHSFGRVWLCDPCGTFNL